MTEHEWQTACEPQAMLEYLDIRGRVSDRKLRLFAVACSRRVWDWIDGLGRGAVETAERFADGFAGSEEMRAARLACQGAGGQAAWYAAASNPSIAARNAARSAQAGVASNGGPGAEAAEVLAQAALARDIFGPLHPVSVDPIWATSAVIRLAQAIYDEKAFARMPSFAEQLQKAGCANEEIVSHCQEPGEHVRGCWVLDLILGKR